MRAARQDEQARGVDAQRHVGEPERDRLVLGDRLAELAALLGVRDRVLERRAGEPRRGGAERDARAVERRHQAAEARALLAEPAVVGDEAVLEEQLGVDDRALAHLAHRRAERQPGIVAVEQERRHAAVAAARLDGREDDVELRDAAVGDPRLLTAEHVAAVDRAARSSHRRPRRSRLGLGRRERGHRRALAGERAQPALLLLPVPSSSTGSAKKPFDVIRLPMPAQPWQSSSCTRQPVKLRSARRRRAPRGA